MTSSNRYLAAAAVVAFLGVTTLPSTAAAQRLSLRPQIGFKMTGTRHTTDRTVPLPGGGSIHEVTVVGVTRAGNPN